MAPSRDERCLKAQRAIDAAAQSQNLDALRQALKEGEALQEALEEDCQRARTCNELSAAMPLRSDFAGRSWAKTVRRRGQTVLLACKKACADEGPCYISD